jgi:hypothetical protein
VPRYCGDQAVQLLCIVRRAEYVAIRANHDGGATHLRHPVREEHVGLNEIVHIALRAGVWRAGWCSWPDNDPFPTQAAPLSERLGAQPRLCIGCCRRDEDRNCNRSSRRTALPAAS